ncbi:hypothetical protein QE361_000893 [Sphingomonas sp. SORGH_AS802]|uniref:hypothetical protein n=1 Tax=unclassified Sphingomonas TaxID=196159 RepID=UPI002864677E|nr:MULTISPECIES: hypothetical protein [unclassified Sphingomonas]MDR6127145.1 hypothetical protein [Sphingomonas sp. SORGH_AS_0438]MDR6133935.1 hypothetical protein [Sphingomonas sp. SORGH_AS_0802]
MRAVWALPVVMMAAMPVLAQTPRDLLTAAAYQDSDKAAALGKIDRARSVALAELKTDGNDQEAAIIAAIAMAYRAKLSGTRGEALAARREIEALVARYPRNAEAQLALGAWHLGIINRVGKIMARAGAGARQDVGLAALDRAVALGGSRASIVGLAAMLRIEIDPADVTGRNWLEAAVKAGAPAPLDRIAQRAVQQVLVALRRGDRKTAQVLADRQLPFGWFKG